MYTNYFKESVDERFRIVPAPAADCWIHAENASIDDINRLSKILDVDSEDIKDALDMMEIARIERLEKDAFVVYVRYPYIQEIGLYTATLTIILAKNHLATICPATCHIVGKLLSEKTSIATNMRTQLLINILLRIVQEYSKVIRRVRAEVINQEKDISTVSDKEITELTRKEENLNQCQNSLQPLKEVIEAILSGKFTTLSEKDQDLLEDLLLATEQAEEMCSLSLRIISSLRNSVQIIITNQFNKTIRLLTALTIILTFPTVISSIYGMNIPLPFARSPHAFYIIMGSVLFIIICTLAFFKRRKWL
jgi:magnesium transporter